MAGIYIPNMDMPKSCSVCRLFGEYGCPFIGAVGHALTRGERNEDCPLVPVPHGGWIPVTEQLPKEYEYVLCKTYNGMEVGYHRNEWGQDEWTTGKFASGSFDVTHWMHLPEPPKEVSK